jgi:hypothetical protein
MSNDKTPIIEMEAKAFDQLAKRLKISDEAGFIYIDNTGYISWNHPDYLRFDNFRGSHEIEDKLVMFKKKVEPRFEVELEDCGKLILKAGEMGNLNFYKVLDIKIVR